MAERITAAAVIGAVQYSTQRRRNLTRLFVRRTQKEVSLLFFLLFFSLQDTAKPGTMELSEDEWRRVCTLVYK